ncbi:hypothetical protein ACKKBG_A39150 [Auxenochlorella protothecoides x Auxenochlorella symbiontica]
MSKAGPSPVVDVAKARLDLESGVNQHGPTLLRLALHDALTWDDSSRGGGANASIAVPLELARPGNGGRQPGLIVVEDLMALHPGLSMADAIQLAGAVAVEALGGPHIPIRLGRRDIRVPPPSARLPTYDTCSSLGPGALLASFRRMGLSVRQGVALCGAHPFGRFWSSPKVWEELYPSLEALTPESPAGGSPRRSVAPQPPPTFDVEIYRDILEGRDPLSIFLLGDPSARAAMEAFLVNPDLWLVEYAKAFLEVSEAPLGPRASLLTAWGRAGSKEVGAALGVAACVAALTVHLWRRRRARRVL